MSISFRFIVIQCCVCFVALVFGVFLAGVYFKIERQKDVSLAEFMLSEEDLNEEDRKVLANQLRTIKLNHRWAACSLLLNVVVGTVMKKSGEASLVSIVDKFPNILRCYSFLGVIMSESEEMERVRASIIKKLLSSESMSENMKKVKKFSEDCFEAAKGCRV